MNDELHTSLTIQSLYEKNQELYKHLINYKPEFEIDYHQDQIIVSMKLNGQTTHATLSNDAIEYYPLEEQVTMLAEDLLDPFRNLIIDMITKEVNIINQNLKQWGTS
jgi:hypothetical protein